MQRSFLRSLTGKTLVRLAAAGSVLLIAAAAVNSYWLYRTSESEAVSRLAAAAAERSRVAERVLGYTVETHETVRQAFIERWPRYRDSATTRRFESLLARYPDGIWRNRQELSDGRIHPTGWVPKATTLTDELRQLLVLFWDLSVRYGPGAALRRDNLFFMSLPDETNVGYDPYLFPNWVFDIPEKFSQLDYEWGRLAYLPSRPGERSRYATPDVDDVGPHLGPLFQVLTPIHDGQRHIATVATTLPLKEFIDRAIPQALGGQRYLVFHGNGRLFADTEQADTIAPTTSKATLQQLGAGLGHSLTAAAAHAGLLGHAGYSASEDTYFAVARIDGPPWYMAALLPGEAVRADALRVAFRTLAAHGAVLLVLLGLLAWILRRQVAAPLGELTRAAEQVASGAAPDPLTSRRDDELGLLAATFNDMADRVAERDAALRRDKEEIEATLTSLRLTEERWRAMTENASDFIAVVDRAGVLTYVSPPVRKALGAAAPALHGTRLAERVHPDDHDALRQQLSAPSDAAIQFRARHDDGSWRILEAVGSDMRRHAAVGGIVLNVRDVTETIRAETQLRQAQKLEAIGTLAGGIAHDFNNILAAILGYGEMAQRNAPEGTALRRHLDSALSAGMRAKSLVERILAFSRSGTGAQTAVRVQAVVEEALDLIGAALPAGIVVERSLDADRAAVMGDSTQVHQVVMNLCTNAIQAMKAHGTLVVALDVVTLDETRVTTRVLPAGDYVRLKVADSGSGIDTAVLERIFDPFFTTKGVGVGTGLGLSLVHSIANDLGGGIHVASEPGVGSTFTIFMPLHGMVDATAGTDVAAPHGEGETILLVDDEETLVRLGEETLAALGYEPVGFTSSRLALETFRAGPARFDAVLSDESMPEMSGNELAQAIHAIRPGLPILLMTGFVNAAVVDSARSAGVLEVLAKPLLSRDVALALQAALRR